MNEQTTPGAEHELTEQEAVLRAQNGDPAGFEYLYRCTSKRVYSICLRMLKNATDAEDMTQQVFLQLFRKIGNFRGEARFSTYAYRVTFNAVLMHLRRKRVVEVHPESSAPDEARPEPHSDFGPKDTSMSCAIDRLNLKRAIRRLPEGYKRIFMLHDVMGYEHHEIAEIVGCSVGCSKSQVHKARKRLQQLLCGEQA
jgi:RNA polymerase sigma-70 factor (ECF subfamily)